MENWRGEYNIADSATKAASVEVLRTHLKTVNWSGAGDVITWRYAQCCDGFSEASRRAVQITPNGEAGLRICVLLDGTQESYDSKCGPKFFDQFVCVTCRRELREA